jgi:hypothetical protein
MLSGNVSTKNLLSQEFMLLTNDNTVSNVDMNLALTKLTRNSLTKAWQVPLIFGGESDDFAGSVSELPDGRILVVGTMTVGGLSGQKKMVLMKLNAEGKLTK